MLFVVFLSLFNHGLLTVRYTGKMDQSGSVRHKEQLLTIQKCCRKSGQEETAVSVQTKKGIWNLLHVKQQFSSLIFTYSIGFDRQQISASHNINHTSLSSSSQAHQKEF
jgi:hypothetical protein